jgi:two-component system chemotaxis response regulator CheB
VLAVVHLPPEGRSLLPEIFEPRCRIPVKEAEDKESIRGGVVYFAAPNYHLLVEADHTLSLSSDEPVLFSRPSIDVLFKSAADAYGTGALALVLTGANNDGASGAQSVVAAGGKVWVQKPEATDAALMPQSVLAACPEARAFALSDLARELESVGGVR